MNKPMILTVDQILDIIFMYKKLCNVMPVKAKYLRDLEYWMEPLEIRKKEV